MIDTGATRKAIIRARRHRAIGTSETLTTEAGAIVAIAIIRTVVQTCSQGAIKARVPGVAHTRSVQAFTVTRAVVMAHLGRAIVTRETGTAIA